RPIPRRHRRFRRMRRDPMAPPASRCARVFAARKRPFRADSTVYREVWFGRTHSEMPPSGPRYDETQLVTKDVLSRPSRLVTVLFLSLAILAGTALVILVGFGPF